MPKITTADCVAFVIDYIKANPKLINDLFSVDMVTWTNLEDEDHPEPLDADEIAEFKKLYDPKYWKRESKRKASSLDSSYRHTYYKAYPDTRIPGEELGDGYTKPFGIVAIPLDMVATVRTFYFTEMDGQVAYEVLELKDGSLRLGDYIGD